MTKYKKKDPFMKKDDPRNNYTEVIPIDEIEEENTKNKIPEGVFKTASVIGVLLIAIYVFFPIAIIVFFFYLLGAFN